MSRRAGGLAVALLCLAACARLPMAQLDRSQQLAQAAQPTASACLQPSGCAIESPVLERARSLTDDGRSGSRHHVTLLERGDDALLARIHLIRAARESIELQSYIFVEDDVGWLVLNELVQAARRGVRVRLLLDQLFSVDDVQMLAALAAAHGNLQARLYNPTFGKASTGPMEFAAGIVCCFRRFNQRMHAKLLRVDGVAAISGGRNIQARYYDWDPVYNYRDRDLLLLGPTVAEMGANFELFWQHPRSVPVARLHDVAAIVLDDHGQARERPAPRLDRVERVVAVSAQANNGKTVAERLLSPGFDVGRVDYLADGPDKHSPVADERKAEMGAELRELLHAAERSVVLQTPYLVISKPARRAFRELRRREDSPEVLVSTNSLAATDAWPVYALSHKYKRTYLRSLGMDIREYKPYPRRLPISPGVLADLVAAGAVSSETAVPRSEWRGSGTDPGRPTGSGGSGGSAFSRHQPLPLERAGLRFGLHAKSLVIDGEIGVVGSHNFDPRSDDLNTESALVVHDRAFAAALEEIIRIDAAPDNAWVIARRRQPPILSGLNYSIGKAFEWLPLFDLWPFRYATSYQRAPDCPEAEPVGVLADSPCWLAVGDFPEVDVPLKSLYTRLMTAFGAGLEPIL